VFTRRDFAKAIFGGAGAALAFPATAAALASKAVGEIGMGNDWEVDTLQAAFLRVRIEGRTYITLTTGFERRDKGFLRTFTLPGAGSTSFLTVHDGIVLGAIYAPDGRMHMVERSPRERRVSRAERMREFDCSAVEGVVSEGAKREIKAAAVTEAAAAPPSRRRPSLPEPKAQIKLLELYTADALAGAGSAAQMEGLIKAAADQQNQAAKDSGASSVQFAIADMALTPYIPKNSAGEDLSWLTADANVALLRRQANADAVVLWTDIGSDAAWCPVDDASFVPGMGFALCSRFGALEQFGHAHEVGHVCGLNHNEENIFGVASLAYPYARGYENTAMKRQTIMSKYSDPSGLFYTQIPRYSNPNMPYKGFATGAPMANNALMLRQKGWAVSQYHLKLG
jgi:hypothetical protein